MEQTEEILMCGCGTSGLNVQYHSGQPECGACWDWRKITGPMARYWVSAITESTERLYLDPKSGSTAPDMNDRLHFGKHGLTEPFNIAVENLQSIKKHFEGLITAERERVKAGRIAAGLDKE